MTRIAFLIALFFVNNIILGASKEEIKNRVESVLRRLPASTNAAVLIYNPLSQDTILNLNSTMSMIPASNTKLFTTATALSLLGGDFYISTKLMTDDNNLNDGVINGNLYIKGYGNPLFTSEDISDMASELRQLGITRITGQVIGDDTYFDDIYTRDDWIRDEVANVKLPPISALVVDRNTVRTSSKRGRRVRTYYTDVSNPPLNAATRLRETLADYGISVNGSPSSGETPGNSMTITESKVLLREIISRINKNSDNFMAECLFKTIGAAASGTQGNSFYSTQAILTYIEDNGIFNTGTAVVDGSGISRFNQITAGAIVGLLENMYFDVKHFEDYYNSLSIAGIDGTLRRRMTGTRAENNFRGKTGTLNGVSSLSGYVTTETGEDIIVSIMFEFKAGGAYLHRDIQDDIVALLAAWD